MGYGIVSDSIGVSAIFCQNFMLVLDFVFLELFLFGLLLPSFFVSFHSFDQSGLVEMVLSISFLLSYESVVDFMIFVETLLFYNKAGHYM